MKLAKRMGIAVITATALMCGCSPRLYYKSVWRSAPITADGNLEEWTLPLKYYDPASKSSFSISNDDINLYLCIEVTDHEAINGLVERGLRIWLDTTGKKKRVTGILCPLPHVKTDRELPQHKVSGGWMPGGYNRNPTKNVNLPADTSKRESVRTRFLNSVKRIHVTGFNTIANGILNLPDSSSGIDIGVSWDEPNKMIYEISIPLISFYHPLSRAADTVKKIGITFNFTSVPKNYHSNNPNGNGVVGGFSPFMGFGFGGFGFGPMGMMDDGDWGEGNIPPQPQDRTIWLPVHLSER